MSATRVDVAPVSGSAYLTEFVILMISSGVRHHNPSRRILGTRVPVELQGRETSIKEVMFPGKVIIHVNERDARALDFGIRLELRYVKSKTLL
jgi:hypothetical protein